MHVPAIVSPRSVRMMVGSLLDTETIPIVFERVYEITFIIAYNL